MIGRNGYGADIRTGQKSGLCSDMFPMSFADHRGKQLSEVSEILFLFAYNVYLLSDLDILYRKSNKRLATGG